MLVDPHAIAHAFVLEEGFHRADWGKVGSWIERHMEQASHVQAWNEAALMWVGLLRGDLGGGYHALQSDGAIVLSDLALDVAQWLLRYAGNTAAAIKQSLPQIAWQQSASKRVVLIFGDEDDYYQYVAWYCPDGEQPASGGMCIHSGYTHIAIPWRDELDAANAIVHELTHDCLAHLPLPLWLNEGVAVVLQKALAPVPRSHGQSEQDSLSGAFIQWKPPVMWDELAQRHDAFWNEENTQTFWAGTSFYQPGDSNELSYSLAEVLVTLLGEKGGAFQDFLKTACRDDAGQTAAMDVLGVELGDLAGTFLGQGNWSPRRKALIESWQKAGWQSSSPEDEPSTSAGE